MIIIDLIKILSFDYYATSDNLPKVQLFTFLQGALNRQGDITPMGHCLAQLPLEPRLSQTILLSCLFRCGDPMITIAAASCFREPWVSNDSRLISGTLDSIDPLKLNNPPTILLICQVFFFVRPFSTVIEVTGSYL